MNQKQKYEMVFTEPKTDEDLKKLKKFLFYHTVRDSHVYVLVDIKMFVKVKAILEGYFVKLKNVLIRYDLQDKTQFNMIMFFSNGTRELNGGRDASVLNVELNDLFEYFEDKSVQGGESIKL